MKVVLAGGSGSLGRRLADDLAGLGHEVVILTRSPDSVRGALRHRAVEWDGRTVGAWANELDGAILVNLAGQLVDRRPTAANVALLRRSRVEPTRALVDAAATVATPPPVWVQMSTVAIYGDRGEEILDEESPPADRPPQMAGVATAWEAAASGAPAGRQVVLRTSVVLDHGTPAFDRLTGLVRWGLGGRIGNGQQWFSWLHAADFLAIVRRVIDDDSLSGVVHATSPTPVRNAELMATLRRSLRRPIGLPAPAPLVHVGALAMRTDPALALTGRRCVPGRLRRAGFEFRHPELAGAVADLLT